jgi:hypothetical protein
MQFLILLLKPLNNQCLEANLSQVCITLGFCAFVLVHHSHAWSFIKTTAIAILSSTLPFRHHSNYSFPTKFLSPYLPCQTPIRFLAYLYWPNTLYQEDLDPLVLSDVLMVATIENLIHGIHQCKF